MSDTPFETTTPATTDTPASSDPQTSTADTPAPLTDVAQPTPTVDQDNEPVVVDALVNALAAFKQAVIDPLVAKVGELAVRVDELLAGGTASSSASAITFGEAPAGVDVADETTRIESALGVDDHVQNPPTV